MSSTDNYITTVLRSEDHLHALWNDTRLTTPAFVYDEGNIKAKLRLLSHFKDQTGCKVLYSIKALNMTSLLKMLVPRVDGFSVSSTFECQLASEILNGQGSIHLTSPGLRSTDLPVIRAHCDYLSFNSLSQWHEYASSLHGVQCGLRVNPGLSFARDKRFDPSRPGSKLGVPLSDLPKSLLLPDSLSGLHIHNNCESRDFNQLVISLKQITRERPDIIERLDWMNLGGGYLFDDLDDFEPLVKKLDALEKQYDLDVFIEPGKAIVGSAGYLVATVVDLFPSDDRLIAVLDTTVNHLPEVFEYQYRPKLLRANPLGKYAYRIAGASCLSGDLFGDYCFDHELYIGSRIIIANVGAYMLVKANMFNGINLPSIYSLNSRGELTLQKTYTYNDFRVRL